MTVALRENIHERLGLVLLVEQILVVREGVILDGRLGDLVEIGDRREFLTVASNLEHKFRVRDSVVEGSRTVGGSLNLQRRRVRSISGGGGATMREGSSPRA